MTSRHVCTSCIRSLRQHIAELRPAHPPRQIRTLSTTGTRWQQQPQKKKQPQEASYATPRPKQPVTASEPESKASGDKPVASSLAQKLREAVPSFTETYVAYGTCEILVKECCRVAEYTIPEEQRQTQMVPDADRGIDVGVGKGWWYEELGLTPNFNTWAQITFLHMWLLTVRLRQFPGEHAPAWHQHLTDHFFYLAEEKMVELHGLSVRGVRNRYLKDLFVQWRGLTAAYDQGIVEGDAVLAAALWRNIFGAVGATGEGKDGKEAAVTATSTSADAAFDLRKLAMITSYVRSVLRGLEAISDEDIAKGEVVFEDPAGEATLVGQKSKLWDQPFPTAGTEADVSS